jgi:hypothetical protein
VTATPWWRSALDQLRISGLVAALFAAYLVLSGLWAGRGEVVLEYRENGQSAEVRVRDGCLVLHKDTSSRGRDLVLTYCPARVPEGAGGWAPQLREHYTVDASRRVVTELVVFGMMPEPVVRARFTLPGGQAVEAGTRRVAGLREPVLLLHRRPAGLGVDLAETDGRTEFVRIELFDAAGAVVPLV